VEQDEERMRPFGIGPPQIAELEWLAPVHMPLGSGGRRGIVENLPTVARSVHE
jgi:hypothetical protein